MAIQHTKPDRPHSRGSRRGGRKVARCRRVRSLTIEAPERRRVASPTLADRLGGPARGPGPVPACCASPPEPASHRLAPVPAMCCREGQSATAAGREVGASWGTYHRGSLARPGDLQRQLFSQALVVDPAGADSVESASRPLGRESAPRLCVPPQGRAPRSRAKIAPGRPLRAE